MWFPKVVVIFLLLVLLQVSDFTAVSGHDIDSLSTWTSMAENLIGCKTVIFVSVKCFFDSLCSEEVNKQLKKYDFAINKRWKTSLSNDRPIMHLLILNTDISKSIHARLLIFHNCPIVTAIISCWNQFYFNFDASDFIRLLHCLGQLCTILLTVGSPIWHDNFSPCVFKYLSQKV